MGNWRTVQIVGTCNGVDVPKLRAAIRWDSKSMQGFHCLMYTGGICGLGNWAAEKISAISNLAERDYSVKAVAKTLGELAKKAPSLKVKIHCGDDNESKKCIATITLEDGKATVGKPEIKKSPEIPKGQMALNLRRQLMW